MKTKFNTFVNTLKTYIEQGNLLIKEKVIPFSENLLVSFVKVCVNIIYYGLKTKIGVLLMIFGGIYGFVGVTSPDPSSGLQWFVFYCWFIVGFATSLVAALFFYEPLSDFLYKRVGREYIVSRIGNFPGKNLFTGFWGSVTVVLIWNWRDAWDTLNNTRELQNLIVNIRQENDQEAHRFHQQNMDLVPELREQGLSQEDVQEFIEHSVKARAYSLNTGADTYDANTKANMQNALDHRTPAQELARTIDRALSKTENTQRIETGAHEAGETAPSVGSVVGDVATSGRNMLFGGDKESNKESNKESGKESGKDK